MTRKDYELLANVISASIFDQMPGDGVQGVYNVASRLAAALERDNPRFDSRRFYEACGLYPDQMEAR